MKTYLLVLCMGLVFQLAACGEDSPPVQEDQGTPSIDMTVNADQAALDVSQVQPDQGVPDQGVPDQAAPQPDLAMPQPLTSSHNGWQVPSCTGALCHTLPITEGAHINTTAIADCAGCHGGNGACNPDSPQSGKTDHNKGSSCSMCHQSQHGGGYTNSNCKACHYAAAGVVDCP